MSSMLISPLLRIGCACLTRHGCQLPVGPMSWHVIPRNVCVSFNLPSIVSFSVKYSKKHLLPYQLSKRALANIRAFCTSAYWLTATRPSYLVIAGALLGHIFIIVFVNSSIAAARCLLNKLILRVWKSSADSLLRSRTIFASGDSSIEWQLDMTIDSISLFLQLYPSEIWRGRVWGTWIVPISGMI